MTIEMSFAHHFMHIDIKLLARVTNTNQ